MVLIFPAWILRFAQFPAVARVECGRHKFENLEIARIQVDELHCFVQKRERRVSIEESDEVGEQYTYIGMDADTKLVFSWLTGKRSTVNTITFYARSVLAYRVGFAYATHYRWMGTVQTGCRCHLPRFRGPRAIAKSLCP